MTREPVGARARIRLALWIASVVAWFAIMRSFGHGDVYSALGPLACLITALVGWTQRKQLASWFAPRLRALGIGVAIGVSMTLLTYPLFRLGQSLVPTLSTSVQLLYADAHSTTFAAALSWIVVVVLAEELLFRGALPATLAQWLPQRAALAISVVLYALAQLGTGSAIVTALACVCGSIWTAERYLTDSVLSSLVSHLIWTPIVLVLHPVT